MPNEKQASDHESPDGTDFIEVTGCATRADWEDLYLATRQLARKHGLSVELFELEPMRPGESQAVSDSAVDTDETIAVSE